MDILLLVGLGALLLFFMFNSRNKQKQRMQQIKDNLVPGATVMTTFGVYGTVLSVDPEENKVTLESGPGTTLVVHRQAIGQIDSPVAEAVEPEATEAELETTEDTTAEEPRITDAELDAMNAAKRRDTDPLETPEAETGTGNAESADVVEPAEPAETTDTAAAGESADVVEPTQDPDTERPDGSSQR